MPEVGEGAGSTGTDPGQGAGGAPADGTGTQGGTGAPNPNNGGQGVQPPATVSAEQHEQVRQRMQAADRRASELEQQLKAIRDKDLPEAEKMKRDFGELQQRCQQLEADLRQSRIDNAFLRDNTHNWHDPGAALRLADLSAVDIDEKGTVTGLKEALAAVAKANAWMLKPGSGSEGNNDGGTGGNATPPATPPMNGQAGTGAPSRSQMAARLPMLNTRRRVG